MENPEMLNIIDQEQERALINEVVGKLTSACWDKCITGTPGSKFSSGETACLSNCAQRYLDTSAYYEACSEHPMKTQKFDVPTQLQDVNR